MPNTVSVIVPCRNEAAHIAAFAASVLAQRLPAGLALEVVVADGRSDDGTRERLHALAAADVRLRWIDNPARTTPVALNRAIAVAQGEWIVRMDVHTTYADDYVAQCVAALQATGATCVGGPWRAVADEGHAVAAAIAAAFGSRFGAGGAASRRLDHSGEVDTVYLGAWRRDDLLRLGAFDEAFVRNQDDELALRIVRSGGRIWQSAAIRSCYVPRASFGALFRQFWQYGYWKVAVIRKHRLPASPRHLVPFAFVATAVLLALAAPWSVLAAGALATLLGVYAAAALAAAAGVAPPWRHPLRWAAVAVAFGCMHTGYGLGFARGLLDHGLRRRAGARATTLTR
ncbi:MAG: glycosyltransferase family 2 protein [Burkholderiaceae bacterium]|nr:glycosyltransferase family 2 protein [Burkholderiaceae bacterium]